KVNFNKHDGKEVALHRKDRWVEQYHMRDESLKEYLPYVLNCTHVAHFTENTFAEEIGNIKQLGDFCFKASKDEIGWKPEKDHDSSIKYLLWWAAVPPESWEDNVKTRIPDLLTKYRDVLGNSPAFNGENNCGPIGFVISWKDI